MKIKNLLLVSLLFMSVVVKSQITQLGTLSNSRAGYVSYSFLDERILYYLDTTQLYLLNDDLSERAIVECRYQSDYELYSVSSISKHVFNQDDQVEFLVVYKHKTARPWQYHVFLMNDLGDIVFDFGQNYNNGFVILKDSGNLLLLRGTNISTTYSLPSAPASVAVNQTSQESLIDCFPNPADTYVTIPYKVNAYTTLSILTIEGKTIAHYLLDSNQSEVRVDVSSLTPGVYVYHYNQVSKQFIVK